MSHVLPDRRVRRRWEIGAVALLLFVVVGGTLTWYYARAWEARANSSLSVDISRSVTAGSPFVCRLRDGAGAPFEVRLAASDEKVGRSTDPSCAADLGEPVAEGSYHFELSSGESSVGRRQPATPFAEGYAGSFNLKYHWVYVLRSRWERQPDLLVVEQYLSCNLRTGRLFFIQDGRLAPVGFLVPGQQRSLDFDWNPHALWPSGQARFQSEDYDNSAGVKHRRTWYFRPETATLEQVQIRD